MLAYIKNATLLCTHRTTTKTNKTMKNTNPTHAVVRFSGHTGTKEFFRGTQQECKEYKKTAKDKFKTLFIVIL